MFRNLLRLVVKRFLVGNWGVLRLVWSRNREKLSIKIGKHIKKCRGTATWQVHGTMMTMCLIQRKKNKRLSTLTDKDKLKLKMQNFSSLEGKPSLYRNQRIRQKMLKISRVYSSLENQRNINKTCNHLKLFTDRHFKYLMKH